MIGMSRLLSGSNIKSTELSMKSLKSEKSELKRSIKELKRLSDPAKPRNSLIHRFLGAKLAAQKINVRVRARFISSVKRTYGSSNEEINKNHNKLILRLSASGSKALQSKTKLLNDIKILKSEINKKLTTVESKAIRVKIDSPVSHSSPKPSNKFHIDDLIRGISFKYYSSEETTCPQTGSLLEDIKKTPHAIKNKSESHVNDEHFYEDIEPKEHVYINESSDSDSGYASQAEDSAYLPMDKFRTHAFDYVEMNNIATGQISNEPIYDEVK